MRLAVLDRSWTRPDPTSTQVRRDLVLGVVAALGCVVSAEIWHSSTGSSLGAGGVEAYVAFGLAGALLAGRRRYPLTIALAQSALFIVIGERLGDFGATFTVQMIVFASLYAAWAWSQRPRALYAATALVVVAMFTWLVIALLRPGGLPTGSYGLLDAAAAAFVYSVLINVVYFGGAVAWGQAAYNSARRSALIAEQQETERALRVREQQRAVHDERLRIARDLHDVVAHHVSGIGVQAAGAGRVIDRDPDAARAALDVIESSSREAVRQMHQLVGLLREQGRDADGTRAPQPGLDDLPHLVEAPMEFHEVGTPFAVPETVAVSQYRVAQEAVTNVRRHAAARRSSLFLRYIDATERAVEVEVVDDGRGTTPSAEAGGYGLRGIAERASLHDGEVEVGPRPQGGFRVRVRIPVGTP